MVVEDGINDVSELGVLNQWLLGCPVVGRRPGIAAVDDEVLEHGRVKQLAGFAGGSIVSITRTGEKREHCLQASRQFLAFNISLLEQPPRIGDLRPHLCLAVLEFFHWQCVCHIRVNELALLAFKYNEALSLFGGQLILLGEHDVEIGGRLCFDLRQGFCVEPHARPDGGNFCLDRSGGQVRQVAVCPPCVAP